MATTTLPEVRTAALAKGMFFKTNKRWYLADSDATPASGHSENFPKHRIRAYNTEGFLSWLEIYGETVETNAGDKAPESFSQHKLTAQAKRLEDQADGLYNRVARIRQFANYLKYNSEV